MKIKMLLLLSVFSAHVQAEDQVQGNSSFLTVGNGNSCDFNEIQAAVTFAKNSMGSIDTIRVASDKDYPENVTIDDMDILITGGYDNCSNAALNIGDLSKPAVYGSNEGVIIKVTGDGLTREVDIRHLAIGNANAGIETTANANIRVRDLVIVNNNNAGIFIFGGDNFVTLENVVIYGTEGSAVACFGENNSINIQGESELRNNESPTQGGGMSIGSACKANVYAPTVIAENTAAQNGGGIYVSGGSLVNLRGINVSYNQADSDSDNDGNGGGLFVKDPLSIVNAINVTFEGNSAYSGGAVAAHDDGSFTSYAENTQNNPCVNEGQCTEYKGNTAVSRGGVLHATTQGQIKVLHANITGNGLLDHGLVAHSSVDGVIDIEGSMIVKNGGEDLPGSSLFFSNGVSGNNLATIRLNHVTIADNHVLNGESVVRNFFGVFSMNASIVIDDVDVSNAVAPESHSFECVMAHETDSFSAGGTVTVNDPQFANPTINDYHLKPTSPAIDYCYDAEPLTVELGYDIDFENRNYDDPNVTDLHGHYDIGADEYRWDNDLIFMDGFESD